MMSESVSLAIKEENNKVREYKAETNILILVHILCLQLKAQIPVLKKAYLDEQTECKAAKVV